MSFLTILQAVAALLVPKKQIYCALFVSEERSKYSFLSETQLYSGMMYPFQLSPHCGENLIAGEKLPDCGMGCID